MEEPVKSVAPSIWDGRIAKKRWKKMEEYSKLIREAWNTYAFLTCIPFRQIVCPHENKIEYHTPEYAFDCKDCGYYYR